MGEGRDYIYCIAEHYIVLTTENLELDVNRIIPQLRIFERGEVVGKPLFKMTVSVENIQSKQNYHEIGNFDTGNGHIKVEKDNVSGDYQFLIRNIRENPVCKLHTNKDFSLCKCTLLSHPDYTYGLNDAIMLAFAFSSARYSTLLIHASCVKCGDYAYAFIAKSGTGKSTQVANWLKYIPNSEMLNDDNPIVRIIDGKPFVYGSPWSGKTPCYRNTKCKLGAITRIARANHNSITKEPPVAAFASLLPSCSTMKWDTEIYNSLMDTITNVIEIIGIHTLYCLPDRESAEVSSQALLIK